MGHKFWIPPQYILTGALTIYKIVQSRVYCEEKHVCRKELVQSSNVHSFIEKNNVIQHLDANDDNGFTLVFDKRSRNPLYVVETLKRKDNMNNDENNNYVKSNDATLRDSSHGRPAFFMEPSITKAIFKVNPKDYNYSKYDRGHMAAAANYSNSAHLKKSTFTMANICPQAPLLNKGFWAKFEAWIRHQLLGAQRIAKSNEKQIEPLFQEVMIITGPVYAPIFLQDIGEWVYFHRSIGHFPKLISVPTHFFKIIVAKVTTNESRKALDKNPVYAVGAFLVSNSYSDVVSCFTRNGVAHPTYT